jgi:hypothetical protein
LFCCACVFTTLLPKEASGGKTKQGLRCERDLGRARCCRGAGARGDVLRGAPLLLPRYHSRPNGVCVAAGFFYNVPAPDLCWW